VRLSLVTGSVTSDAPRVQEGQEGAAAPRLDFASVYEEHFAFVWRSLRRLGVASAQLDDASQDVFLVIYRRLDDFEGRSSVKTWIFGIVLKIVRTYKRTAARKPTEPLEGDIAALASPAEELTDAARAARLMHSLLDELDDAPRAVFILSELEEMTAPEISAALGVNLNTVYSRLRAARRDFDAALVRHRLRNPQ
jgi:RNA polymerase sigma-70 factor (ECF subfamily)